jgi:hypothetical protein
LLKTVINIASSKKPVTKRAFTEGATNVLDNIYIYLYYKKLLKDIASYIIALGSNPERLATGGETLLLYVYLCN